MYPDFLFNAIGITNWLAWILIVYAYAVFEILYNFVMSFLVGGIQQVGKGDEKVSGLRAKTLLAFKEFKQGSKERLQEFLGDRMWWQWALTSFAGPISVYGISRIVIAQDLSSLTKLNINISQYQYLPEKIYGLSNFDIRVLYQFIILAISLIITSRTFIKYRYQRSERTWFSKSAFFHISKLALFDLPLAYAVINIIVMWLFFIEALIFMLLDDGLGYWLLSPDLMYGFKTINTSIVVMGTILVLISFLPLLMLGREKNEAYSKEYKLLTYTLLFIVLPVFSLLIILFNYRLSNIREQALIEASLLNQGDRLLAFIFLSDLPEKLSFPAWLKVLFNIRILIFVIFDLFEFTKSAFPNNRKLHLITKKIRDFLNTILDVT